ncbi:DNA-binding transcriptional regulator, LysR family [Xaviernesmea oryzae]|uniref:HTH-type transcriptional regulator TtuA n=1 Tax=Xaviernesmea oryzae TaxID=464029 RepID=A0A1X7E1I1_9HYPH|nr:LysR family transcriptional regulator [Xaviernesmea oryzae]SMF25439.1 DNA-binding transcriptional regulator, LysR family [Xaviernesmea oryzae]
MSKTPTLRKHPEGARPLSPALLARIFHQPSVLYFKGVAETLSVRECSRRLNVASSAVSRQITQLEEALDMTLFQRDGKRLRLTEAGEILHRHVCRISAPIEAAVSELDMLRGLKTGSVRIATSETVGLMVLPKLLAEFSELYPTIHLDVSVMSSLDVVKSLAEEHIDIGFAFVTEPPTQVQMTTSHEVTVGVAMRSDHPLASLPEIRLADCFSYPVAIGKPGLTIRDAIEPLLETYALLNKPILEAGSNAMLMELTLIGHHVAILTSFGAFDRAQRENTIFRPLVDEDLPPHHFGLMVRLASNLHFAPAIFHSFATKKMEALTKTRL